jgi:hypothetical protein
MYALVRSCSDCLYFFSLCFSPFNGWLAVELCVAWTQPAALILTFMSAAFAFTLLFMAGEQLQNVALETTSKETGPVRKL